MCLIIKRIKHLTLKPKKAKKDIIAYKLLTPRPLLDDGLLSNDLYLTPFRHCIVNIKKPFICNVFDTPHLYSNNKEYFINFGIHTYKNIRSIKKKYNISHIPKGSFAIFKCIIPEGTLYWVGKYGEYASERIEFVEQVY